MKSRGEKERYLAENSPQGTNFLMYRYGDTQFYATECFTLGRNGEGVSFEMRKKIPLEILAKICLYFTSQLPYEALVRIYHKDGEYHLDIPEVIRASKVNIVVPPPDRDKGLLVCEIHSHNTMSAFFSSVDDADEIYPGIYGVIGKLDEEIPQMRFRVVYDAEKRRVYSKDIFEVS